MDTSKQCFILDELPEIIFGAEEDENGAGGDQNDSGNDSGDSSQDDDKNAGNASGSSDDDSSHDDADDPKVKGLKSALETERAEKKAKDKQLKALLREKQEREDAEKTEIDQHKDKAEKAMTKVELLAATLLKRDLDSAIRAAAKDFIDPDDALNGIDRSKLVFEQDEDDPTDITIDLKSIEREVKNLATKKPHFLNKGTDDGEPTGGQFGGSSRKKKTSDEALKEKYPSLSN